MKRKPRILVVGSLVMDLISSTNRFPRSGETIIGLDFSTAPGGKGANQAVQAARLGACVSMIGKIGRDDFGATIRQSLNDSGVNTEGIGVSETRPTAIGNIQLEVTDNGTANRILVIPGANMDWDEGEISALTDRITQYDMVILQLEIPLAINLAVARIAHGNGVPVMLNSAPSAPLPDELLECLTYISPNEHEMADMTGIRVRDDATAQQAIRCLLDKGVENVLITLGSQGAAFGNRHGYWKQPCVDYGPVEDPTAAGDSFVAAFCTAVCLGADWENVLRFANHTAGITVSRMGAQPSLPTIEEVLTFMQANGFPIERFACLKEGC